MSGTSAVPNRVFAKYRAPGGAACAATYNTDSGAPLFGGFGQAVNGAFSIALAETWTPPGTFVFCYWVTTDGNTITTPFTQAITFRAPTGTITATIDPITPTVDQPATITVTGVSEAPESVFATVRPAGGACAPTYQADTGNGLISNRAVNGAFSTPVTYTPSAAGSYILCLWLADSSSDVTPIAGPQPQPFNVVGPPPPPPVVVPASHYSSGATVRRRGARYSGRVASTGLGCKGSRTVALRRLGSGTKSFGRVLTRANGTFTIKRAHRLRGNVYVTVLVRSPSAQVICDSTRSGSIRG